MNNLLENVKLSYLTGENYIYGIIAISLINVMLMVIIAQVYIKKLQECSYKTNKYKYWYLQNGNRYNIRLIMLSGLSFLGFLLATLSLSFIDSEYIAYVGFLIYIIFLIIYFKRDENKFIFTEIEYNNRVGRLIFTYSFLTLIFNFLILLLSVNISFLLHRDESVIGRLVYLCRFAFICLTPILIPTFVKLANVINTPFENIWLRRKMKKLQISLKNYESIKKIIIFGDYGKSTIKKILRYLLKPNSNVLTFTDYRLGTNSKIEDIQYDYMLIEVSYNLFDDVLGLIETYNPEIAIINNMSEYQRLIFTDVINRSKIKTCYFIPSTVTDLNVFENCKKEKINLTGEINYKITERSLENTHFETKILGKEYSLDTCLLGEINVKYICSAIYIVTKLQGEIKDINQILKGIKPVHHELELIENNEYKVIDDSYIKNIDALSQNIKDVGSLNFAGKKYLITSGIPEYFIAGIVPNQNYGMEISKIFDKVILVGRNGALHIREGLISSSYDEKNIIMVNSQSEGIKKIKEIASQDDLVLIECGE